MAVYSVTHHQRLDNYAVVQLLTNADITPGDTFTLAGLGHGLNGTHTVYACPLFLFIGVDDQGDLLLDPQFPIENQVLFYDEGADLERGEAIPNGTLTITPVCTWITAGNIEDWLGIGTATAADQSFLTQCAAAANAFCYRRRREAGYLDSLSTSPSGDVSLGAIQYGGMLYRQRGSIDSFASFDGMGGGPVTGLNGVIKQLLGIDRPQVA
jgi:hypothetical protein